MPRPSGDVGLVPGRDLRKFTRKKVRLITPGGDVEIVSPDRAELLIRADIAEVLYMTPITIRIIDNRVYQEELRHLSGRITHVSRHKQHQDGGLGDPVSMAQRKDQATVGNHSTRAKPPRHTTSRIDREIQRYKTRWLIIWGKKEQARAKMRARA